MFDNRLQPSNEPLISSSYTTTEQAQPLFTLTAEEVEIVKHYLSFALRHKVFLGENLDIKQSIKMREIDKIITRIKQWQDEQKNNNNS